MRTLTLTLLVAALAAACGPETDRIERRPRTPGATRDLGMGDLYGKPITLGTIREPVGGTYFDLVVPPLPAGASTVPLKAVLEGPNGAYDITSVHVANGTWAGTPVTTGAYTLTFVDDAGKRSTLTRDVVVSAGKANYLVMGAIQVAPESAVATDRTGVTGLTYEISVDGKVVKTAPAALGAVVVLPPGASVWRAVDVNGLRGKPYALTVQDKITPHPWGSLQIRHNGVTVQLKDSIEALLVSAAKDGEEYLLPAAPEAEGCRVYLPTVVQTTVVFTRTLCSDGSAHQVLDMR